MALFLSILEGRSPKTARPLLATSDPALIEVVRREIWNRMTSEEGDREPPGTLKAVLQGRPQAGGDAA